MFRRENYCGLINSPMGGVNYQCPMDGSLVQGYSEGPGMGSDCLCLYVFPY